MFRASPHVPKQLLKAGWLGGDWTEAHCGSTVRRGGARGAAGICCGVRGLLGVLASLVRGLARIFKFCFGLISGLLGRVARLLGLGMQLLNLAQYFVDLLGQIGGALMIAFGTFPRG